LPLVYRIIPIRLTHIGKLAVDLRMLYGFPS